MSFLRLRLVTCIWWAKDFAVVVLQWCLVSVKLWLFGAPCHFSPLGVHHGFKVVAYIALFGFERKPVTLGFMLSIWQCRKANEK